jgi:hypothetical protein
MGTFVGTSANTGNVTALTTANSAAVTWPTVQAGDLAVLAWTMQNTATPTDPTSQAFTLASPMVDDGSCRSRILTRVCTGSESGAISGWSNSIQNRQSAVLFVVRGYSAVSAIVSASEAGTSTTHDCPAVGTGNGAANGDSVIVIATDRAGTTTTGTPPAGFSKRTTSETGSVGGGGTYTGIADDGLTTAQTFPVDPASWTLTSGSTAVTWTLALRRNALNGTGDRTATATLTGAAAADKAVAGDLAGTATLTGAASASKSASGNLSATATLTGAATAAKSASGNLAATATLTGAASVIHNPNGTGDLTATGTLTGAALVDHRAAGDLTATALLTGTGELTKVGAGDLSAVVTLAGSALVLKPTAGDLAATATLTGAAEVYPHFDPAIRTTAAARRATATATAREGSTATARRSAATATVRSPA